MLENRGPQEIVRFETSYWFKIRGLKTGGALVFLVTLMDMGTSDYGSLGTRVVSGVRVSVRPFVHNCHLLAFRF